MEWPQFASVLGEKPAVFRAFSHAVLATLAFFQSCIANSNQCEGHLESIFSITDFRLLFSGIP